MRNLISRWYAIALLILCGINAADAQTTWTKCADEGGTCTITGQKHVRYGQRWTPAGAGTWTPVSTRTGTFKCENATFVTPQLPNGDPSPGTGKECQVMDVTTGPPPVANPVTYVVTYTTPTKNVDGSAIAAPVTVIMQASPTEAFLPAQTYEWVADQPQPAGVERNIVVTTAPPGVLFWRVFTKDVAGALSNPTTPLIRTEKQYVASTAPTCEPLREGGDPTKATRAYYTLEWTGGAMYFACKMPDGTWKDAGTYGRYKPICISRYALAQNIEDAAARQAELKAIWADCIDARAPGETLPWKPLYDDLVAKYRPAAPPPPAQWKVSALAGSVNRPAYRLLNGARTATVIGRVAFGAPCDCAAHSSGAAPSVYCAVTGQDNAATAAVDQLPASAAICAKTQ